MEGDRRSGGIQVHKDTRFGTNAPTACLLPSWSRAKGTSCLPYKTKLTAGALFVEDEGAKASRNGRYSDEQSHPRTSPDFLALLNFVLAFKVSKSKRRNVRESESHRIARKAWKHGTRKRESGA
jgi:hypothetical protein